MATLSMGLALVLLALTSSGTLAQLVEPELTSIEPEVLAQGASNVVTITGSDFGNKPTVTIGHKECAYVKVTSDTTLECTVAGLPRSDHSTRIPVLVHVDGLESQELLATLEPSSPEVTVELSTVGISVERELKTFLRSALKLESSDQIRVTNVDAQPNDVTTVSFIVLSSKMQPNAHRLAPEHIQSSLSSLTDNQRSSMTVRSVHVRAVKYELSPQAQDALVVSAIIFGFGAILTGIVLAMRKTAKKKKSRSGPKKPKSSMLQDTNAPEQFSPSDETVMV